MQISGKINRNMKQLLLICILLIGVGQTASFAQNDDIYFNSADIEKQKAEDKKKAEEAARMRAQQNEDQYSSSGQNGSSDGDYKAYGKSYDNDGYSDYNGDDYYYSSNIRRFNYPFYNMGYYSAFHNPYWYNPYWYDPYWGYSAWNRPGFSVSFGYGPYWSSYGGWYNWYGYNAFNSYWNYPYYASPYGSYYSGYWNGYYAGLYNGGGNGGGRTITYGPRNSSDFGRNTRDRAGLRSATVSNPLNAGPRAGFRTTNEGTVVNEGGTRVTNSRVSEATGRTETTRNANVDRPVENADRPSRSRFSRTEENSRPVYQQDRQQQQISEDRPASRPRQEARPIYQSPRQEQRMERQPQRMQRYEQQRSEPRYEAPRSEPRFQSSPRMESPRMSSPAPSRSSGGSFGGGRSGGRR